MNAKQLASIATEARTTKLKNATELLKQEMSNAAARGEFSIVIHSDAWSSSEIRRSVGSAHIVSFGEDIYDELKEIVRGFTKDGFEVNDVTFFGVQVSW